MAIKGLIVALALGGTGVALADDTVRVRVHAEHATGRVIYHYQIENRGSADLRQIILGCECQTADRIVPMLETLPVGAQYGYAATDPTLPPELVRVPPGWQVHAHRPPGSDKYWLEWHAVGARGLAPGQVAKGFSIALPHSDRAFLIGRYTIPERSGIGTLEPLDATPPRLTLTLEETAPLRAGETVRVRVMASAQDDYDPAPRLAFESFTPDETAPVAPIRWSGAGIAARPLRYIVTYSATDASGNTSRTSIKVTVPAPAGDGGGSVTLPTAGRCGAGMCLPMG